MPWNAGFPRFIFSTSNPDPWPTPRFFNLITRLLKLGLFQHCFGNLQIIIHSFDLIFNYPFLELSLALADLSHLALLRLFFWRISQHLTLIFDLTSLPDGFSIGITAADGILDLDFSWSPFLFFLLICSSPLFINSSHLDYRLTFLLTSSHQMGGGNDLVINNYGTYDPYGQFQYSLLFLCYSKKTKRINPSQYPRV